jgi:uridine kinase
VGAVIARLLERRETATVALVVGFATRVAIIVILVPTVQTVWFVPFFENAIATPSIDPWGTFLAAGGDPRAFPYGPVMFAVMGAAAAASAWLPGAWSVQLGVAGGILVLELLIWVTAMRWVPERRSRIALLFAASPILIYAAYVHGQLDMLPTLLMFASGLMLVRRRWFGSGLLVGLAIAAKFSSLLLPPLVIVFLLRNARFRGQTKKYLLGLLPGVALAVAPVVLPGYRQMVLETPTAQSVFVYAAELGPGLTIVILPVTFVAILALQYRFLRGNPDLVILLVGIALSAVTLLTPASPGWYIWAVPFVVVVVARLSLRFAALVWSWWAVATVTLALRASGGEPRLRADGGAPEPFVEVGSFVNELGTVGAVLSTATVVLGVAVLVLLFRRAVAVFDLYRLSRAPLVVAIAGDSGTGKDTLCVSLSDVFGEEATAFIMGDDYHLYDRQAPLWGVTTHLHPAANDLTALSRDAVALISGSSRVWSKHYDHDRGRFAKPALVRKRELVVINGLHALIPYDIRRRSDLLVYTSMEEGLRRRLKIERDVVARGHSREGVLASMARREEHARRFVEPQSALADVVLRLESAAELPAEDEPLSGPLRLRLVATLRKSTFAERLQRDLVALADCPAHLEYEDEPGSVRLVVYPDRLTAGDIAGIAGNLVERPEELFLRSPVWRDGSIGLIQLIAVLALLERRVAAQNGVPR